MTEVYIQLVSIFKIIWLAGYVTLYGFGGMYGTKYRRVFGSLFLGAGIILFSLLLKTFSFWYIGYPLLLWGATSIGYGANELHIKILKRLGYGTAIGFAAIAIAVPTQHWGMWVFHIVLCISVSIYFGTFSATRNARSEETLIAATIGLLPLYMV